MDTSKLVLGVCLTLFGAIGAYLPNLFGDNDPLSMWSLLGGTVGGFVGIWVWYKLKDSIG